MLESHTCTAKATMRMVPVATLAAAIGLAGCNSTGSTPSGASGTARESKSIQVKGSDTMLNVVQGWAEAYAKVNPAVKVEVTGGGSGPGIAALAKGLIDISTASRNMKPEEKAATLKATGKDAVEFVIGYDALALYVHKDNPLTEITFEQIAQIYKEGGTINKWSEMGVKLSSGGSDEIVRVSRQSSSGTYEFLREHVLNKKDFKNGSRDMNGSKEVVELVGSTPSAIGYSGMGYATSSVKMLKVSKAAGQPAVAPSMQAALDQSYPIARSLQLYTAGPPSGQVKGFIDWILSDAGQKIVETTGYVPIPADKRTK